MQLLTKCQFFVMRVMMLTNLNDIYERFDGRFNVCGRN